MKIFLKTLLAVVVLILILSASQCNNKSPSPEEIKIYSYTDSIINPPDSFQIVFNISVVGDKYAHVTFKDSTVWLIEKLGDSRITFFIENNKDTKIILSKDTLALKGGFHYTFVANNNYYSEFTTFYTQLTKLNLDYKTFKHKF